MESAFRTWLREKKEGQRPQFWDDLTRELQMALGTAKWQVIAHVLPDFCLFCIAICVGLTFILSVSSSA